MFEGVVFNLSVSLFWVIFLIGVAVLGFAYGYWFETKRKPRFKIKKKDK